MKVATQTDFTTTHTIESWVRFLVAATAGSIAKLLNRTHLGSVADGQPILEAWAQPELWETGKPGQSPAELLGHL